MEKSSEIGYDGVIATRLRLLCECNPITGKKTTYTALGDYLGIKNQSVSQWARGETIPDTKHIVPIAEYFGVTCDYFLGKELAPNHAVEDICSEIPLATETVRTLQLFNVVAEQEKAMSQYFHVEKSLNSYERKALDHLIANCNSILATIGLYLFGDFMELDKVKIKDATINLTQADECVRNGLLHKLTLHLMEYRKELLENDGDLPLGRVIEETRAAFKAGFIETRVEYLERIRNRKLTDEERHQLEELCEQALYKMGEELQAELEKLEKLP